MSCTCILFVCPAILPVILPRTHTHTHTQASQRENKGPRNMLGRTTHTEVVLCSSSLESPLVLLIPFGHVNLTGTRPCLQPAYMGCFPCEAYPRAAAVPSRLPPLTLPSTPHLNAPPILPPVHCRTHVDPLVLLCPYPVWKLFWGDPLKRKVLLWGGVTY